VRRTYKTVSHLNTLYLYDMLEFVSF
jgi:hypothetical protein